MTSPRTSPLPSGQPDYIQHRPSAQSSRHGGDLTQHDRPSAGSSMLTGAPPIFSKRARQIQEEDGISLPGPSPVGTPTGSNPLSHKSAQFREGGESLFGGLLRGPALDHLGHSEGADQPNKGRARAGTLPSSWLGPNQPVRPGEGPTGSRYADRLNVGAHMARSGASSPIAYSDATDHPNPDDADLRRSAIRSNSSMGTPYPSGYAGSQRSGPGPSTLSSEVSNALPYSDLHHSNNMASRFRSGSLASGLQSDPFGPDFFSAWTDDRTHRPPQNALRETQPARGRGATIANPSGSGVPSLSGAGVTNAASNFDSIDQDIRTLDYLGLDDSHGTDFDLLTHRTANLAGRDRATTLASAPHRSRLEEDARDLGTARYSSSDRWNLVNEIAPSNHSPAEHGAQTHMPPYGQHGGLAQSALQQRLGDDFHRGVQSSVGRARAISVGMLDAPHAASDVHSGRNDRFLDARPSPPYLSAHPTSTAGDSVSQEDLYSYALDHGLDPEAFARAAASAGVTVTPSRDHSIGNAARQNTTRLRAGTIAALGGAGGRMRTEQELLRMAGAGSKAPNRGHLASYPLLDEVSAFQARPPPPGPMVPMGGQGGPSVARQGNAGSSASSQQATRSLWVGNLGPSTTGQELMQAFASYGAIESLRLLPEKECGFVNFVDIEDAVRARDDVMNRLGGRIRATGTGPGGTVRIGFGKIDTPSDSTHMQPPGAASASGPGASRFRSSSPAAGATVTPGGDRDENYPTRALWIGSIPNTTTPAALLSLFQPYGPIESARVLTHKNCGFINFERVDDAVRARKMLNGRDLLGSEVGAVRIGFAKIPNRGMEDAFAKDPSGESLGDIMPALETLKGAAAISADHQALSGGLENYRSNLVTDLLHKQQQNRASQVQTSTSTDSQHTRRSGVLPAGPVHPAVSALSLSHTRSASNSGLSASSSIVPSSEKGGVPLPSEMQPRATSTDMQLIMEQLSQGEAAEDAEAALASVQQFRPPATYYTSIPLVSEPTNSRRFDTNKLRDLRKAIEQGQYLQGDIDSLAKGYLDSIVDLASDYIGNTVVQKFFEKCSEPMKTAMLERLAPHLATIGIHKNGTWAAQKIVDTSQLPEQRALISHNVRPYLPPLLLDQFGNYVVQCLLPYGAHSADEPTTESESDFIFDSIVDRCWEIAQGRFGARSVRACLESNHATRLQRKRVAIAIILNAVPLTTSPNGALLLTWLLDASNLSGRYGLLAPRFTPHLTHLCTHKLASQTVLRVVNQNLEPDAAHKILDALFDSPNDAVLEEILTDQVHGSQFLTKLLSSAHLPANRHDKYVEQVKRMVVDHNLVSVPAYRKLIEDLGLSFVSGPHASANGPLMRVAQTPPQPHTGHGDGPSHGGSSFSPDGVGGMFGHMTLGGPPANLPPVAYQGVPGMAGSSRGSNFVGNQQSSPVINRYDGGRSPPTIGIGSASTYSRPGMVPPTSRGGNTFAPSWNGSGGGGVNGSTPPLGAPRPGGLENQAVFYSGSHSPVNHHHAAAGGFEGPGFRNSAYGGRRPEQTAGFSPYDTGVHTMYNPGEASFAFGQQTGQGAPQPHFFGGGMASGSPGTGGAYGGGWNYDARFDA